MNVLRRILFHPVTWLLVFSLLLAACNEQEPTPVPVPQATTAVVAEVADAATDDPTATVMATPTTATAPTNTPVPAPAATVTLAPDTVLPTTAGPTPTTDPFPGAESYLTVQAPADSGHTGASLFDAPGGNQLGFVGNDASIPIYGCDDSYCATYDIDHIMGGAEEVSARRWISRTYLKNVPANIKEVDANDWVTTATGNPEVNTLGTPVGDPTVDGCPI